MATFNIRDARFATDADRARAIAAAEAWIASRPDVDLSEACADASDDWAALETVALAALTEGWATPDIEGAYLELSE